MRLTAFTFLFSFFSFVAAAQQNVDSIYMREHYEKSEYEIPMRDGIKLFTVVYTPKDKSKTYPILMNRTCYNASRYAEYKTNGHPSNFLVRDGYILVFQDVRGRYMSEGAFNNMTPNVPGNNPKNKKDIDDFDKQYIDRVVDEHKKAIEHFTDQANKTGDADTKAWLNTQLALLREHLDNAMTLQSKLENKR